MPKSSFRKKSQSTARRLTMGLALAGSLAAPAAFLRADDSAKIDKLEQENQDLKKRLEALEAVAKAEGILPDAKSSHVLTKVAGTTISGFVSASYFYDLSNPPGAGSPGYLWGYKEKNSFSINKFKLTIASPAVERSGDKWDVGYRASLIFGNDAGVLNSNNPLGNSSLSSLREAFVEANAPIGTGLNIKVGELISLLNYESGDGGAANDNFSQGYQWFYTGNGPAAGAQIGYTFTDWLDVKVRVQNGLYAGPIDHNTGKTVMGAIGIKPSSTTWISLIGFTGREEAVSKIVEGGSMLGGWQVTDQLHFGTELDYFIFDQGVTDHTVWSAGAFLSYALTDKLAPAVRAEFLSDADGADASGDPLEFAPNSGQDIASVAFTLNYKPAPNIKIQPEIRFDHTSLPAGFGSKTDRVIVGAGVSYLF